MNVAVLLEQRFDRTSDGSVWTLGPCAYSFWARYLEVFDGVRVIARVREVPAAAPGARRADGDRVRFGAVAHYLGPWQYLRRRRIIRRSLSSALGAEDAVIFRVGSVLAGLVEPRLRRAGQPYGLEVVGDPYQVFAPGVVRHPLRPVFRWWFSRQLRRQCAHAAGVAYVTDHALQRRYPPGRGALATSYSSIDLPATAIVAAPRTYAHNRSATTLITIGSLAQLYKAPDVLIDAVAHCIRDGMDLRLVLLGDGKHRPELERRAAGHGLNGRVRFLGELPAGDAVRAALDQADLFLLPSKTEGLPRAMIEAMARGLPCIGSTVGGIPELLPAEDMVAPGDRNALACKIREIVSDPARMARMSARNLRVAERYQEEILRRRRREFYTHLRHATECSLARSRNV